MQFVFIVSIYLFSLHFSSIITPRYLYFEHLGIPIICSLLLLDYFFLLPIPYILIIPDLFLFKYILFFIYHCSINIIYSFIISLFWLIDAISSARARTFLFKRQSLLYCWLFSFLSLYYNKFYWEVISFNPSIKSSMYILNNVGDINDPCKTPF